MTSQGSSIDTMEIVDLEERAKRGDASENRIDKDDSHRSLRFRIRIDRERYVVEVPCMTGHELLELAGKNPPNQYQIFQKLRGGQMEQIEPHEKADFTRPGVERFVTLPIDQTEG